MACLKLIGFWRSPVAPAFCTCCIARSLCRGVSLAHTRTGYYLLVVPTVNLAIGDLMASCGWRGVAHWYRKANGIAPTLVGGSKKHGGPDLGPTRARKQWAELGIDGLGIANAAPAEDFPADGLPRLTLRMAARIQAFPDSWQFVGGKTAAYRQIGNALPPLVAQAVGESIMAALTGIHSENHTPSWLFQPNLLYKREPSQSFTGFGKAIKQLDFSPQTMLPFLHEL